MANNDFSSYGDTFIFQVHHLYDVIPSKTEKLVHFYIIFILIFTFSKAMTSIGFLSYLAEIFTLKCAYGFLRRLRSILLNPKFGSQK